MKKLISARLAGNTLLISLGLLVVFHVLVLFSVVPSDIVWGGQVAASPDNLLVLELVALLITLLFAAIIAAKINYIPAGKLKIVVTIGMWLVFAYLLLNTVGNLASGVSVEKLIFAPITILLTLFALRLAIE